MSQATPLTYTSHKGLGWHAPTTVGAVAVQGPYVALASHELERFGIRVPIVLRVKGGTASPVIPVGLYGTPPTRLIGEDGTWRLSHVPSALLSGPFLFAEHASREMILIETAKAGPVSEDPQRIPFYTENGDLHPETEAHINRVIEWRRARLAAGFAATALLEAGLLTRWSEDDASLHRVDPQALVALSSDMAGALHASGALRLAHVSIASLGTIVAGQQVSAAKRKPPEPTSAPQDDANAFLDALREDFA